MLPIIFLPVINLRVSSAKHPILHSVVEATRWDDGQQCKYATHYSFLLNRGRKFSCHAIVTVNKWMLAVYSQTGCRCLLLLLSVVELLTSSRHWCFSSGVTLLWMATSLSRFSPELLRLRWGEAIVFIKCRSWESFKILSALRSCGRGSGEGTGIQMWLVGVEKVSTHWIVEQGGGNCL